MANISVSQNSILITDFNPDTPSFFISKTSIHDIHIRSANGDVVYDVLNIVLQNCKILSFCTETDYDGEDGIFPVSNINNNPPSTTDGMFWTIIANLDPYFD